MVRLKRSWVRKRIQASIALDRQVAVTTRDRTIILPHGRVLANLGTIDLDGVQYYVTRTQATTTAPAPSTTFARTAPWPVSSMGGATRGPAGHSENQACPFRFPVRCTTEPDPVGNRTSAPCCSEAWTRR